MKLQDLLKTWFIEVDCIEEKVGLTYHGLQNAKEGEVYGFKVVEKKGEMIRFQWVKLHDEWQEE